MAEYCLLGDIATPIVERLVAMTPHVIESVGAALPAGFRRGSPNASSADCASLRNDLPTCRGSDPAAVRTRAAESRRIRTFAFPSMASSRHRAARIPLSFLDIHLLLHRNNYKIKGDQFYSLIQVNNSFNF
jgi:hypothetical protein